MIAVNFALSSFAVWLEAQTAPITPRSDAARPGDNRAGGGARREGEGGRTGRLDLIH